MSRALALVFALSAFGCSASVSSNASPAEQSTPAEPEPPATVPDAVEPEPAAPEVSDPEGPPQAFVLPDDVPPLDSDCKTRRDFTLNRRDKALEFAAKGCTADAQCVQTRVSTECRGGCPTAVLAKHAEAYEAFLDSLDARVCQGYRDDGCPYATPRCASGVPACIDGMCQWSRG